MEEFIRHQKLTQYKDFDLKYLTIGLCGEVGEVCNEIKKLERDDNNILTDNRLQKIKLELGDVLWYYIGICNKLDVSIDDIIKENIKKLQDYNAAGGVIIEKS